MSQVQRKFIRKLTVFCIVLLGVAVSVFLVVKPAWYTYLFPAQFFLISLFTFVSFNRLLKVCDANPLRFSSVYIGSTTIKLFAYLAFLVICLLLTKVKVFEFLITFLVLYLCFTIFEVVQLLSFCNSKKK